MVTGFVCQNPLWRWLWRKTVDAYREARRRLMGSPYTTEFDGSRADSLMKFFEALVVNDMIDNNWDSSRQRGLNMKVKMVEAYSNHRFDINVLMKTRSHAMLGIFIRLFILQMAKDWSMDQFYLKVDVWTGFDSTLSRVSPQFPMHDDDTIDVYPRCKP